MISFPVGAEASGCFDACALHDPQFSNAQPLGKPAPTGANRLNLRRQSASAVERLAEPSAYSAVGLERLYARQPCSGSGPNQWAKNCFVSAEPMYPVDAAVALLDWNEFIGGPNSHRRETLAARIGRGIATDFSLAGHGDKRLGAGAFWERLTLTGNAAAAFSDIHGGNTLSVTATAEIADALFRLHERTGDRICLNAALRASHWLLLKQTTEGLYDGDRFDARSGAAIKDDAGGRQAAVHAAEALIRAFQATCSDVYIKAAMRALQATTNCGKMTQDEICRCIRSLTLAYSESASARLRRDIDQASELLLENMSADIFPTSFGASAHAEFSRVEAALNLFAVTQETHWLAMGLNALSAATALSLPCAESISLFLKTMLALTALIPGCQPDLRGGHVRVGWSSYSADRATYGTIDAQASNMQGEPVDYLPLVSKIGRSVLIPVLADRNVQAVTILSGARQPNLVDLVSGEAVCQPAFLHDLPFQSDLRWGCFVIEH